MVCVFLVLQTVTVHADVCKNLKRPAETMAVDDQQRKKRTAFGDLTNVSTIFQIDSYDKSQDIVMNMKHFEI